MKFFHIKIWQKFVFKFKLEYLFNNMTESKSNVEKKRL